MLKYDDFMKLALNEAKKCLRKKEIPVGAIIVDEFKNIISKGYNKVEEKNNPLYHAEKIAIDKALLKLLQPRSLTSWQTMARISRIL